MIGWIYKITNKIDGKIYIGQTIEKDPFRRIRRHFQQVKTKGISYLKRSINKYGKDNFEIDILFCCLDSIYINDMEKYFISYYNCQIPNGYNIKSGGEQGGSLPEEVKKQQGLKVKEWYKNNSHPFKGKKFSESHIEALSKARKGFDSEARKKARAKSHEQMRIKIKAINIQTGEELLFNSLEDCAKALGLVSSCVSRTLRNDQNRSQHKGWKFEKV